jgi:tetratricopeptide (TPR) repeat protein
VLWRALGLLGIMPDDAAAAEAAGLIALQGRVRFRHPLVRSVLYRTASADERAAVHRALARATNPDVDPDRRAWHRAAATMGPDEDVAAELERSADRAQARGELPVAAAFLQRSVALTGDPARRAERALGAAQASFQAGEFDPTLGLLATAETGPLDEFQRARVDLLRAHVDFASSLSIDAPRELLKAARRLEPLDLELARETCVAAWGAAITVAGRSGSGADVFLDVCNSVRALRSPPGDRRSLQLLLGPGTENHAHSAAAVLYNGLARYDEAAASAKQATSNAFDLWTRMWALPELVEAAARAGDTEPARDAFEGCRKRRSPPVPTGRSESRHAAARCSPTGPLPKSSTGSDRTV